jgi:hypothetical protein
LSNGEITNVLLLLLLDIGLLEAVVVVVVVVTSAATVIFHWFGIFPVEFFVDWYTTPPPAGLSSFKDMMGTCRIFIVVVVCGSWNADDEK